MGDPADVSLAATGLPNPADASTDAPAQRHRGLADDAQDGLAEVPTANPLPRIDRGLQWCTGISLCSVLPGLQSPGRWLGLCCVWTGQPLTRKCGQPANAHCRDGQAVSVMGLSGLYVHLQSRPERLLRQLRRGSHLPEPLQAVSACKGLRSQTLGHMRVTRSALTQLMTPVSTSAPTNYLPLGPSLDPFSFPRQ